MTKYFIQEETFIFILSQSDRRLYAKFIYPYD
jgi:hypothetical protein